MHDRLHWSCVARTVFALSHSPRPCICCMAKSIRVEVSDLDISALSLHGHAHLIAWTPRYAYGATARAREGKFTLSGSGAGACANELEDEFEIKRCGGQRMKSLLTHAGRRQIGRQRQVQDGGRRVDPALKDAGTRAGNSVSASTRKEPKRQQLPEEAQRERQPRWPRWRRESKCRKHFNNLRHEVKEKKQHR